MASAAIIPARGGSKRIPRKNIKPFAGRPMLAYAISAALEARLFDVVVVSSDDAEILSIAADLGAEPLTRPGELADDLTPTVPVISHAVTVLRERVNGLSAVCCIYPAVPFLRSQDLRNALDLLQGSDASYAFPIAAFPSAIQRALRLVDGGRAQPFHPEWTDTRTQDLETAYFDAGQFYWGKADAWLSNLSIHANGCGLVIPEWRAVDIDTPNDWHRAELMFRVLGTSDITK